MSLSDKMVDTIVGRIINPEDLKASLKELKEGLCGEMMNNPEQTESSLDRIPQSKISFEINKIFGAGLIGENDD